MSISEFVKDLKPNNSAFGKKAKSLFEGLEFPTSKDEYWKYMRLRKLTNNQFFQKEIDFSSDLNSIWMEGISNHMVIVNGKVDQNLSSYQLDIAIGLEEIQNEIPSKDEINPADDQIFSAIGKTYAEEGIVIHFNDKKEREELQIIFVNTHNSVIANTLIKIKGAKSTNGRVICNYISEGSGIGFTNTYFNISIEENANFELLNLQAENESCFHIQSINGTQQANSNLSVWNFSAGADLIRNNINVVQQGKNCNSHINGLYYGEGKQQIDNHVFIDHASEQCESNELFKGVMNDQSKGIFNGRIIVRKDSQKINAYQQNAHILLSEKATINSKPELEIYADDVKCSHGSVTGQLDKQALFYLQARGISEDKARKMLVSSFLEEVIETLPTDELKNYVVAKMSEKINLLIQE